MKKRSSKVFLLALGAVLIASVPILLLLAQAQIAGIRAGEPQVIVLDAADVDPWGKPGLALGLETPTVVFLDGGVALGTLGALTEPEEGQGVTLFSPGQWESLGREEKRDALDRLAGGAPLVALGFAKEAPLAHVLVATREVLGHLAGQGSPPRVVYLTAPAPRPRGA